jgi:polysaccharide lyase-like protein
MLGSAWTVDNSVMANTVQVVSTQHHSGTNSVHMTFTTASCATFIDETMGVPATGAYWARVWLYANTATDGGHDVYFEAEPSTFKGGTSQTGVRALNTQGNMSINIDPPDNGVTSSMMLPRGVWTCFEWNTTGIGGTGGITVYMNSTQLMTVTGKPIPALGMQRIGYERYGSGTTTGDLYLDDYAIGPTRIGCN